MDLGGTADVETHTSEEVSVKRAKHFHPEQGEFQDENKASGDATQLNSSMQTTLCDSPYPHAILETVWDPSTLETARNEILHEVASTFKETDLFKVYQTGDLTNIDKNHNLDALRKIRDSLYSDSFRSIVSKVTGCKDLSGQIDCSANIYSKGCHLLCHDDVIGTRVVSYIVYLTDPTTEWRIEDGGALELFGADDNGQPHGVPEKVVLPKWNSMVMFRVQPGRSYHTVQEVFSDKPRISISGWYHANSAPENDHLATLKQLQGQDKLVNQNPPPVPIVGPTTADKLIGPQSLNASDIEALSTWINATYLNVDVMAEIAQSFQSQGSLRLARFLKAKYAKAIYLLAKRKDKEDGLGYGSVPIATAGIAPPWILRGPCHKQRFLELSTEDPGVLKAESLESKLVELRSFLSSDSFEKYITALISDTEKSNDCHTRTSFRWPRRFRPGLDYTVAFKGNTSAETTLEGNLCLAVEGNDRDRKLWQSDEVGGYQCFMGIEDDGVGDVAVYQKDDTSDSMESVSASFGSLNLIKQRPNVMQFVKYVSAHAPGSRFDIPFNRKL